MSDTVEFFARLPIFTNLDDESLQALAAIAQEYEFDAGAVIAYQRDAVEEMYIVADGRLYSERIDERGITRETHQYFAGSYFDDMWLFTPGTHPATVTAGQDGRLYLINHHDFIEFLTAHPEALPYLAPKIDSEGHLLEGLSEAAWEEALKIEGRADRRTTAVSLLPDELVEYLARRSGWYLLVRLFWPSLGLLLLPTLTYWSLAGFAPTGVAVGIAAFIAALLLLFIGFRLLDWSNDYFVITNKHLIHREFDLRTFRINVVKIPIKQVQSVEILKPTFIANLFSIGSARVTTAAQRGVILFDNIDDPRLVKQTLNRLSERVQELNAGEAQLAMRLSVDNHFELAPPYRPRGEAKTAPSQTAPTDKSARGRFQSWLAWRVEEDGVITYRKHIFVLFAQVWLPSAAGFVLIGLGYVLGTHTPVNDILVLAVSGFLALINLVWFIWQFEDWRNDIFQVSDRFILDIDRRPFGFGESRKQAPIANVQNVNAERPGLLPTIFNYGSVKVETAGAATDITFENVPRPSNIQADIFRKLEAYEQGQRLQRGAERREEYVVLLDVYRQALEQERIPRRTPRPGEFVEVGDGGG